MDATLPASRLLPRRLARWLVHWLRGSGLARGLAAGVLVLAVGVAGCVSRSAGGSGGRGGGGAEVVELHLLGVPVALKPNRTGAAEGFAVRVFASGRHSAKGMAIRQGTLEILMFDGALGAVNPRAMKPARVWTFSAARLEAHASESALGVGYQFVLNWAGAAPAQNRVTILARYAPPQGAPVFSAPSTIPISSQ